jgi:hypothetical protein
LILKKAMARRSRRDSRSAPRHIGVAATMMIVVQTTISSNAITSESVMLPTSFETRVWSNFLVRGTAILKIAAGRINWKKTEVC